MSNLNSANLPENIRKCMSKESRKAMKAPTAEEVSEKAARGEELELHKQLEAWCRIYDVQIVHSRTDRKSTIEAGWPDFTLLKDGYGCCIECKAEGGKLSPDQEKKLKDLDKSNVPTLVTASLADAIRFARANLNMGESGCSHPKP